MPTFGRSEWSVLCEDEVGAAPCGGPRVDEDIRLYGGVGVLPPQGDHKGRSPLYRKKGGLGGN